MDLNKVFTIAFCVAIGIAFMFVQKIIADLHSKKFFNSNDEIQQQSNTAVAFRYAGMFIALAIGLSPILSNGNMTMGQRIWTFTLDSLVVILLLELSLVINDKILLRRVNNSSVVGDGNTAVGIIEFGSFIATGLIIHGSLVDEGGGIASVIVFFLLGQLVLFVTISLYRFGRLKDVVKQAEIYANTSAGVLVAFNLIAIGVVLNNSLAGQFLGWVSSIKSFLGYAAISIVALTVLEWLIDRVFLPDTSMDIEVVRDKNAAATLYGGALKVAAAILLAAALA